MTRPRGRRGQLVPLLALRLRMVRSGRVRGLLLALLLLPVLLAVVGVLLVDLVPDDQAFNVAVATPTLYLAFALLAIMAPLAAGGGYELYPPEQLVAYPIRPRTVFLQTLLLAPVNLAWMLNVLALVVVTGYAAGPVGWGTVRAAMTVGTYVLLVTVLGHTVAWLVVGIRQSRGGRVLSWALAVGLLLAILVVARLGYAFTVLDASPTQYALINALQGYAGVSGRWLLGMGVMAALAATLVAAGVVATAWTLRRPGDHVLRASARPVRRREPRRSVLAELVVLDRASVWRSVPLRRGIAVLLVLPGTVAALAGLTWPSLILLPGLVAAGAGLLFGVNAFCLDASGSTWLATLPGWDRRAFLAKARVVAEVAALAVTASVVGGALRAPAPESAAAVTATLGAAIATTALVVASSMRASVRHPHQADLRGPRDTPAPPGVMALHSLRFAVVTTLVGLLFSGIALIPVWWAPLVLAVPFVSWAGLSLAESARAWSDPAVRAHVVSVVSGG